MNKDLEIEVNGKKHWVNKAEWDLMMKFRYGDDYEYKAWKRKTSILLGRQSGKEVASRNWALMTELERLELYKKYKYE